MAPCQKRELHISVLFDVIIFSFLNQFQASTMSSFELWNDQFDPHQVK